MQVLAKLRSAFQQKPEQTREELSEKPQQPQPRVLVVPLIFRNYSAGSVSEKLYPKFCNCSTTPELLAVKENICLLSCQKPGCKKRLFRIDTA